MNVLSLRRASPSDLDAVVDVFVSCWRESYAGLLPAATVSAMDEPTAAALWSGLLAGTPGQVVLVLVDDGVVRGVARCSGVGEPEGCVESLYVAPSLQGRGAGGRLLSACRDLLAAEGALAAHLWVFELNAPARGFYARQGWRETAQRRVQDAWGAEEIRLSLDLTPGARP